MQFSTISEDINYRNNDDIFQAYYNTEYVIDALTYDDDQLYRISSQLYIYEAGRRGLYGAVHGYSCQHPGKWDEGGGKAVISRSFQYDKGSACPVLRTGWYVFRGDRSL